MKQKMLILMLSLVISLGVLVPEVMAQSATPTPSSTPRPSSTPTPSSSPSPSATPRPSSTPSPSPTASPRATTTTATTTAKGGEELPTSGAWEVMVLCLMFGCGILGLASYAVLRKKA